MLDAHTESAPNIDLLFRPLVLPFYLLLEEYSVLFHNINSIETKSSVSILSCQKWIKNQCYNYYIAFCIDK